MSYYTSFDGQFLVVPALNSDETLHVNEQFRGWRVSPNGGFLYWPSDASESGGLDAIEYVVRHLTALGHTVTGSAHWLGEDGVTGTICVEGDHIVTSSDPEETLSPTEIERFLNDVRMGSTEPFRNALEMLQYFQVRSPLLVNALTHRLKDPNVDIRLSAAMHLGELAGDAGSAVLALVSALEDEHPWVRAAAAESLGLIGAAASSALPALSILTKDDNYGPRGKAIEAIERITGNKPAG